MAGVAVDNGGFDAVSWDRALLGVAVAVLLCALLVGVARPNLLVALLAALTGWTALSYVWSASPASALVEAQRVALYAAVAAAVVMCARRIPLWSIVAATTVVALWNLATRIHHTGHGTGAGTAPVGYANGLALLCVLGLVLLPAVPRAWWLAGLPLGAVLALQHSDGAYVALLAGVVILLRVRWRLAVAAVAIAALLAAPFVVHGNARSHYWRVAAKEAAEQPLLGGGAGTFVDWWTRKRDVPVQTLEAHSLYVETLAELGPVGLLLVLATFGVALARARSAPLAAGVAVYAVGATVDFHWELAGVTLPAIVLAALATTGTPAREARLRVVVPVTAVVALAALLAYAGNSKLASAQAAEQHGDVARAEADARAALRWQPYSPQPWLVIGDVTHHASAYRRATRLDPEDWLLWQRLASVEHGRLRRLAEAKAAQLNPLGASGS